MQQILTILQGIYKEMQEANRRGAAEFHYYLNSNPPFVAAKSPEGFLYKILPDGKTSFLLGGEVGIPLPGAACPYPEVLWKLALGAWVVRNRRWFPLAILSLLGLVSLQVLLSLSGTGAAMVLPTFSAVMNCLLFVSFGAAVTAAILRNFGRGITVQFGNKDIDFGGLLESGSVDISPDILVASASEGESPLAYIERVEAARTVQADGQLLVVVAYKNQVGIIGFPPDENGVRVEEYFRRDRLTDDISDWKQEVCPPTRFDRETWGDFVAYVHAFCVQYRDWVNWERSKQGKPLDDLLASMRAAAQKAAVILAILFCSLGASAQSAAEWQRDSANFQKIECEILTQCETHAPAFSPLLKLYMSGFPASIVIYCLLFGLIALAAKRVARKWLTLAALFLFSFGASAQSAVPIPTNAGQSIFRSVPDSMELEKLKREMMLSKYQVGREIAPRQMFVMWTFHNWVVPIMFLFGLLAWFWAKAAFRESEHDQGGNVIFGIGIANGGHYARRIVFILAAAIAVVEIADSVIWAFFREQNLWWSAIKCVCLAVLWMYGVNWITPNPRKVDSAPMGQGFPMVGGGQKRIG